MASINITLHGKTVCDRTFELDKDHTSMSTTEPGPGIYDYTGRHDGGEMKEGGKISPITASIQKCKTEGDKVLTEVLEEIKKDRNSSKEERDQKRSKQ